MGLVRALTPSLRAYVSGALVCLAGVASVTCVKEFEIDGTSAGGYLFVDGRVVVGGENQVVKIGRTAAPGAFRSDPVEVTEVSISNLNAGTSYPMQLCPDDTLGFSFCGTFIGKLETSYRLTFTLADGSRYESAPDALEPGTITPTAEMVLRRRIGLDGDTVGTQAVTMKIAFEIPRSGAEGLLVFAPRDLVYFVLDADCGDFDESRVCYGYVEPVLPSLRIFNLADYVAGDRTVSNVGMEDLDWRFAAAAYMQVGYERLSPAAEPYFGTLATSLALTGSFFAERPITVPGNVAQVEAEGDSRLVLGYFGVSEVGILRAKSNALEIRERAPALPCGDLGEPPAELGDCCECLILRRTTEEKPEWWE